MKGLAPGARIALRDEEWLVQRVHPLDDGVEIHAVGLSELVRDLPGVFHSRLEKKIAVLRPETTTLVPDPTPRFRRTRLWLEALDHRLPPTDAGIHVGDQAALDPMDWQLEPARKALRQLRPGILIADGVGLGKTLEVGILLSELIRRGRGDRILVVAIRSLLAQFQQELWQRFAIPLVRLDSRGIERVRQRIPASRNPFHHFPRAIISIDTLKNDGRYRTFLEQAHWDAVVIDECHNVAGAGTQRNRLARLLARRADALVLTSATPHNGRPESFAELIDMLDPTAIADPTDYTADDIRGLFVRRFKKDITAAAGTQLHDRQLHLDDAIASPDEEHLLLGIRDLDHGGGPTAHALFRTTLLKAALSSPHAARETLRTRLHTLEQRIASRDDDHPDLADLRNEHHALSELLERARAAIPTWAKLDTLRSTLARIGFTGGPDSPRVLLFSERITTLEAVHAFLRAEMRFPDDASAVFTARLPDVEQQRLVEEFGRADSPLRMLLATDVASEGVNLHHNCHHLIHIDIPWSIIRLEQRNGRIDRYGQEHPPEISCLLTRARDPQLRADTRILDRLIEKEDWVHRNLGDPALLTQRWNAQDEEDAITAGIAAGEDPETLLPDEPPQDIFELLLGPGALDDDPVTDAHATGTAPDRPFARRDAILPFVRNAIEELADTDAFADVVPPDFSEDGRTLTLVAPPDLRQRFDLLPREAIPDHWRFRLTTDRDRVQRAIRQQRQERGNPTEASDPRAWTNLQLLWPLHPTFRWLVDRVVTRLGRHQAPVVRGEPLPPDAPAHARAADAFFLFTGTTASRAGHVVLAEWMAVPVTFRPPAVTGDILDIRDVLEWTRLLSHPVNRPIDEALVARAEGLRIPASQAAEDHMRHRRLARGQELLADLKVAIRRLKDWAAARHTQAARIEAQAATTSGAAARRLLQQAADLRAETDHRSAQQDRWVREHLSTSDAVHVQLAAVVVV